MVTQFDFMTLNDLETPSIQITWFILNTLITPTLMLDGKLRVKVIFPYIRFLFNFQLSSQSEPYTILFLSRPFSRLIVSIASWRTSTSCKLHLKANFLDHYLKRYFISFNIISSTTSGCPCSTGTLSSCMQKYISRPWYESTVIVQSLTY